MNVWTGSAGPDFDTPGSWTLGHVAAAGEDLVFGVAEDNGPGPLGFSSMTSPDGEGGGVGGTGADCYGMHAPTGGGAYNSVTFESVYVGTVTVVGGFSTGDLNLAGGTLDQGAPGASYSDTDITVTGTATIDTENHHLLAALPANFTWTNGTLNSTSHLATLTVTGGTTTARFEPSNVGKTVGLGSNITLGYGAIGTMKEGTINLLNDGWTFNINANSGLQVDPGSGLTAAFTSLVSTHIQVKANASMTVVTGRFLAAGRMTNAGTFSLLPDTTAAFPGVAGNNIAYLQTGGATQLYGISRLDTGLAKTLKITGGILTTVFDDGTSGYEAYAGILTGTLEITGGDIYINYYSGVPHRVFGRLAVSGDILWTGGTYHPFVLGTTDGGNPPTNSDYWTVAGSMTIQGTAAIDATSVDLDGNPTAPTSGFRWQIIDASNGITAAANTPSYDTGTWILDPITLGGVDRTYRLKAK